VAQKYQFRAIIEAGDGGGAFVVVPFDVEKTFGKKRVKIKALIDGEPYRGTLVRMGSPQHMLIVLKEIREKIGKTVGDEVAVDLEEDLEERIVEVPADIQTAMKREPEALEYFNHLSYTHQKQYVQWVTDAKREETRQARIKRMIEMLIQGKSEH
jgi:small nuclear ribonucleoprotein (snRNP)-like protein